MRRTLLFHVIGIFIFSFAAINRSSAQGVPNANNTGVPENDVFQGSNIENVQINNGNLHLDIPVWSLNGMSLNTSGHFIYDNKGWTYITTCVMQQDVQVCTDAVKPANPNHMIIIFTGSSNYRIVSKFSTNQKCGTTNHDLNSNITLVELNGTFHHLTPDPISDSAQTCWPQFGVTLSGARDIDLDPRLNDLICKFAATNNIQPGQLLFQSRTGGCMNLKTATERLKKHGVKGFHSFRRFRITRLRERAIPEDIVRYWAGHACETISDRYSKLAQNLEIRKKYAGSDEAGLGFDIRLADKPGHPEPSPIKTSNTSKRKRNQTTLSLLEDDVANPDVYVGVDSDLPEIFFDAPASPEAV